MPSGSRLTDARSTASSASCALRLHAAPEHRPSELAACEALDLQATRRRSTIHRPRSTCSAAAGETQTWRSGRPPASSSWRATPRTRRRFTQVAGRADDEGWQASDGDPSGGQNVVLISLRRTPCASAPVGDRRRFVVSLGFVASTGPRSPRRASSTRCDDRRGAAGAHHAARSSPPSRSPASPTWPSGRAHPGSVAPPRRGVRRSAARSTQAEASRFAELRARGGRADLPPCRADGVRRTRRCAARSRAGDLARCDARRDLGDRGGAPARAGSRLRRAAGQALPSRAGSRLQPRTAR